MAGDLSPKQRQALHDLVVAGTLSAEQEAAVRAGLEAAGPGRAADRAPMAG